MASLIMGAWFYMTAVGNFVAGKIGEATGGESGEMTKETTLAIYNTIGWWTIGIGVVVLALSPFVKKWMHLDTLGTIDLAGRPSWPNQAPGMHPEDETAPRPAGHEVGVGARCAGATLLGGVRGSAPPKKAAPIAINEDPYPSTYRAYPGTPTVIRHATVFDGEGGRIDNGTVIASPMAWSRRSARPSSSCRRERSRSTARANG